MERGGGGGEKERLLEEVERGKEAIETREESRDPGGGGREGGGREGG